MSQIKNTRKNIFHREPWFLYRNERQTLREIIRVMSYQDKYHIRRAVPRAIYRNRLYRKTKKRTIKDAKRSPLFWERKLLSLFLIEMGVEVHIPSRPDDIVMICVDDVANKWCTTPLMVSYYRAVTHMTDYHKDMEYSPLCCVYHGDDPIGFFLTFYSFFIYPPDDVYGEHEKNVKKLLQYHCYDARFYTNLSLTFDINEHGLQMVSPFGRILFNDSLSLPAECEDIYRIRFVHAFTRMKDFHDIDWCRKRLASKGKIVYTVDGDDLVIDTHDDVYDDRTVYAIVRDVCKTFHQSLFLYSRNWTEKRKTSTITPYFGDLMVDDMMKKWDNLPIVGGQDIRADSRTGILTGVHTMTEEH